MASKRKHQAPATVLPQSKTRPRELDKPILEFIAYFRVVTTSHVLYHFFIQRDKSPVYGWKVIRLLESNALIETIPVYPEKGAASVRAARLTPLGWAAIGQKMPSWARKTLANEHLEFALQYSEVLVTLGMEGWRQVRGDKAFDALRRWALGQYRNGRVLNEQEILARAALEKMPPFDLGVPLLAHPGQGSVRIVLPLKPGTDIRRLLRKLPSFALFPTIPFEIVTVDPELRDVALNLLDRAAKKQKFTYSVSCLPHFRLRVPARRATRISPESADAGVDG